jgi:DNA polymerase IIIc chi subunit
VKKQEYVMVRMRVEDHARLAAMRERFLEARSNGHPAIQSVDPDLSLSRFIARLVAHVENDQRRKKQSRSRIRARRRAEREAAAFLMKGGRP